MREKSRRTLPRSSSLSSALERHRDGQAQERLAAGERWQEGDFVFTTRTGTPIDPRNALRAWHDPLEQTGRKRRPFHVSRHTAASMLLADKAPATTVQRVLGHALLGTTADAYGHLFPSAFIEAAEAMERAVGNEPGDNPADCSGLATR